MILLKGKNSLGNVEYGLERDSLGVAEVKETRAMRGQ